MIKQIETLNCFYNFHFTITRFLQLPQESACLDCFSTFIHFLLLRDFGSYALHCRKQTRTSITVPSA